MVEYVYAVSPKGDVVKVPCSAEKGNLPDFSAMHLDEAGYEERLRQHDAYLAYLADKKKKRNEYHELFYGNIPFFLEHYDKIVNEPRFANIPMPDTLFGTMYVSLDGMNITLGETLKLYKNEPSYRGTCAKCGGQAYLIHFGFSPLSGRTFPSWRCYGDGCEISGGSWCFDIANRIETAVGNTLWHTRKKYGPTNYGFCDNGKKPVHITELLAYLRGAKADTDGDRTVYSKTGNAGGFSIGKSKTLIQLTEDGIAEAGQTEIVDNAPQIEEPQDVEVNVPLSCWTDEFALAALKAGWIFGNLPDRFKRTAFIRKAIADVDYIPDLGTISPKLLTVDLCVKSIKAYPEKAKRLLKLVPESMRAEVESKL